MANLDSLVLLVHHFGLFFLETQAALGHLGIPKMLPGSLHEHPFHLVTRAGQTHREIQGPLMNLSCQDSPSLREGRQNLYWKTNHFKIRFRSGVSLTKKINKKSYISNITGPMLILSSYHKSLFNRLTLMLDSPTVIV